MAMARLIQPGAFLRGRDLLIPLHRVLVGLIRSQSVLYHVLRIPHHCESRAAAWPLRVCCFSHHGLSLGPPPHYAQGVLVPHQHHRCWAQDGGGAAGLWMGARKTAAGAERVGFAVLL